jgi:tetratricopeptide (TPR) repeat protein
MAGKNETTFQIEQVKLQTLFSERKFEEADELATKMLNNYNKFDYELLLKRARIRQCLMRYEEALVDANIAMKIVPDCLDAYHLLSDCLIATSKYPEAAKILNILAKNDPDNEGLQSHF